MVFKYYEITLPRGGLFASRVRDIVRVRVRVIVRVCIYFPKKARGGMLILFFRVQKGTKNGIFIVQITLTG